MCLEGAASAYPICGTQIGQAVNRFNKMSVNTVAVMFVGVWLIIISGMMWYNECAPIIFTDWVSGSCCVQEFTDATEVEFSYAGQSWA